MDANVSTDRIAVMIDADNTRPAYANEVLSEVAKYGNPTIRRVYGDWTNPHLTQWARKLNSLGLRAMHQNAFTHGKNSTDLALVIDAMDLLYDDNVEAFALVTSDSDFTSLAHRLRESGKTVYVLGENKAPESLRNACDKFIDLAVVAEAPDATDGGSDEPADGSHEPASAEINLESALTRAINAVSDDEGWVPLPTLGNQLIRTHPSFDARTFAGPGARLSTLVAEQPYLETTGSGNAMRVRRKGAGKEPGRDSGKESREPKAPRAESGEARVEPQATKKTRAPRARKAAKSAAPAESVAPAEAEAPKADVPKVTTTTRAARKASSAKKAAAKA